MKKRLFVIAGIITGALLLARRKSHPYFKIGDVIIPKDRSEEDWIWYAMIVKGLPGTGVYEVNLIGEEATYTIEIGQADEYCDLWMTEDQLEQQPPAAFKNATTAGQYADLHLDWQNHDPIIGN